MPKASAARAMAADAAPLSTPPGSVRQVWQSAEAVCFDVDSTVIEVEGIDQLAAAFGAGEAVAELTASAMNGNTKFEDALAARLGLIKPTLQRTTDFVDTHPMPLSPNMLDLVNALKDAGKQVYLVSGGFRQMINPVADLLGVPHDHIYANNILFDSEGAYAGFDDTEPTSRSGGKAEAVRRIKAAGGFDTVVMVGDGATDLEARGEGAADAFICFTGVVNRTNVAERADLAVSSMQDLIDLL